VLNSYDVYGFNLFFYGWTILAISTCDYFDKVAGR